MAFADKKGIAVASGFLLQAEAPIDARFTVATKAELDELVTLHAAYKGLNVYCDEDGLTYKYSKDGTWVAVDAGTSLPETLDKYLAKTGGEMTGPITFDSPTDGYEATIKNDAEGLTISKDLHLSEDFPELSTTPVIRLRDNGFIDILTTEERTRPEEEPDKYGITVNINEHKVEVYGELNSDSDIRASSIHAAGYFYGNLQGEASSAQTASNASHADMADNANMATEAMHATSADNAMSAEQANNAYKADQAQTADYANSAGTAQSAENATNAEHATRADNATSADTASTASRLSSSFTIELTGGASGSASTDGSTNATINVTSLDGSLIQGVLPLSAIPKGAQERCVDVDSKDAMLALTTENVQTGDVVRVVNADGTSEMYYVADETMLGTEEAFKVFTAGRASTVPVTGVEGLDDYLKTYLQGGGPTGEGDFVLGGNVTINKNLTVNGPVTAPEFIGKLTGNADSATKLQTPRNFSVSGAANCTVAEFDGTKDVDIIITNLSATALYVPENDVLILDGNAS